MVADVVPEDPVDHGESLFAAFDRLSCLRQSIRLFQHEARVHRPFRRRLVLARWDVERVLADGVAVDEPFVRPERLGDRLLVELGEIVLTERRDGHIGTDGVELRLEVDDVIVVEVGVEAPRHLPRDPQAVVPVRDAVVARLLQQCDEPAGVELGRSVRVAPFTDQEVSGLDPCVDVDSRGPQGRLDRRPRVGVEEVQTAAAGFEADPDERGGHAQLVLRGVVETREVPSEVPPPELDREAVGLGGRALPRFAARRPPVPIHRTILSALRT